MAKRERERGRNGSRRGAVYCCLDLILIFPVNISLSSFTVCARRCVVVVLSRFGRQGSIPCVALSFTLFLLLVRARARPPAPLPPPLPSSLKPFSLLLQYDDGCFTCCLVGTICSSGAIYHTKNTIIRQMEWVLQNGSSAINAHGPPYVCVISYEHVKLALSCRSALITQ